MEISQLKDQDEVYFLWGTTGWPSFLHAKIIRDHEGVLRVWGYSKYRGKIAARTCSQSLEEFQEGKRDLKVFSEFQDLADYAGKLGIMKRRSTNEQ
jgi:hypothetical protein